MPTPKTKTDPLTVEHLADCFDYLDTLRESGATNMFGARPYLQKEMGLKEDTAREVLRKWLLTFSREKSPTERASQAMAP